MRAVTDYLSQWTSLPIEVMAEEDLVPELRRYPKLRGWRKQQLVKLAACRELSSDYCLTFDADVFSTCPTRRSDLLPAGKALMQYERAGHCIRAGGHRQHACWVSMSLWGS